VGLGERCGRSLPVMGLVVFEAFVLVIFFLCVCACVFYLREVDQAGLLKRDGHSYRHCASALGFESDIQNWHFQGIILHVLSSLITFLLY
jgi:hypothetical protein